MSNLSATSNSVDENGSTAVSTHSSHHDPAAAGFGSPSGAGGVTPLDLQRSNTNTSIASVVATHKAAGVDNALTIVNKSSRRVFSAVECDTLEQVRNWAPLTDLEKVYQALYRQKLSLLDRYV